MSRLALAALVLAATSAPAGTIPAGTDLVVRLEENVETAKKGKYPETFSAWLIQPVIVDGKQMLPAGTVVKGEVRGDKKHVLLAPKQLWLPDGRRLAFNASVRALDRASLTLDEREGTISRQGAKADAVRDTAEGAASGAAETYATTGRGKDTAIGAAVGAGAAIARRKILTSRNPSPIIPIYTQLTLTLNRPLEVP
jgi:hypothetical protein